MAEAATAEVEAKAEAEMAEAEAKAAAALSEADAKAADEKEADDPYERARKDADALAAARQAQEAARQAELTRSIEQASSGMDTWERMKAERFADEPAELETEAAASDDEAEGAVQPDEAAAAESPLAKPSLYARGDEDALEMAIAAEIEAAAEAGTAIAPAAPSIFAPPAAVRNLNLAVEKQKRDDEAFVSDEERRLRANADAFWTNAVAEAARAEQVAVAEAARAERVSKFKANWPRTANILRFFVRRVLGKSGK